VPGYDLDVAACAEAHCAPKWYGLDTGKDGLLLPWFGHVWANIPFSRIDGWLAKAWHEWRRGRVKSISLLMPATRTEQPLWQEHVEPHRDRRGSPLRVAFLRGRTRFSAPGLAGEEIDGSPPFTCVLVMWHRRFVKGFP
jgi:hypothetical protein